MNIISTYQAYQSMAPTCLDKTYKTAKKNALFALGIDTDFFPSGLYSHNKGMKESIVHKSQFIYSYLKWLLSQVLEQKIIIPMPIICFIGDILAKINDRTKLFKSFRSMSEYYLSNPRTEVRNELMATYIRFISSDSGLYDTERINRRVLNILLWRHQIFCSCIKFIYGLKPRVYITWQRSYLGPYSACIEAINRNIPVVLLGASDKMLLKCSDTNVPRHWEWVTDGNIIELIPDNQVRSQKNLEAHKQLNNRLRGELTSNSLIDYMYYNPYSKNYMELEHAMLLRDVGLECERYTEIDKEWLGKNREGFICVYMHMFDDYHHHGVLPNFASSYYHWLKISLTILDKNMLPYVLKLHPTILSPNHRNIAKRAVSGLNHISAELRKKVPISFSETTPQLIQNGMKLGLTVCGTIGTELIFQGCPILCCGNPPYKNFLQSRLVSNVEDYENKIKGYKKAETVKKTELDIMLNYLSYKIELANYHEISLKDRSCVQKHSLKIV